LQCDFPAVQRDPIKSVDELKKQREEFFRLHEDTFIFPDLPSLHIAFGFVDAPPPDRKIVVIPQIGAEIGLNDDVSFDDVALSFVENLKNSLIDRLRLFYPNPIDGTQPGGNLGNLVDLSIESVGSAIGDTINDVFDPSIEFNPDGFGEWITVGGAGSIAAGLIYVVDEYTSLGGFNFELPTGFGRIDGFQYETIFGRKEGDVYGGIDVNEEFPLIPGAAIHAGAN
jgi:hypothetical protein